MERVDGRRLSVVASGVAAGAASGVTASSGGCVSTLKLNHEDMEENMEDRDQGVWHPLTLRSHIPLHFTHLGKNNFELKVSSSRIDVPR